MSTVCVVIQELQEPEKISTAFPSVAECDAPVCQQSIVPHSLVGWYVSTTSCSSRPSLSSPSLTSWEHRHKVNACMDANGSPALVVAKRGSPLLTTEVNIEGWLSACLLGRRVLLLQVVGSRAIHRGRILGNLQYQEGNLARTPNGGGASACICRGVKSHIPVARES